MSNFLPPRPTSAAVPPCANVLCTSTSGPRKFSWRVARAGEQTKKLCMPKAAVLPHGFTEQETSSVLKKNRMAGANAAWTYLKEH